jgi:hypothetical protein
METDDMKIDNGNNFNGMTSTLFLSLDDGPLAPFVIIPGHHGGVVSSLCIVLFELMHRL